MVKDASGRIWFGGHVRWPLWRYGFTTQCNQEGTHFVSHVFRCARPSSGILVLDCAWIVMAHVQTPHFVFRRNGQVHLNLQGRQFSRLLAAEVCPSAVVMVHSPCSEVVWRVLATHSIRQFPLHFPSLRHRVPSHFNWTLPNGILKIAETAETCRRGLIMYLFVTFQCLLCWLHVWWNWSTRQRCVTEVRCNVYSYRKIGLTLRVSSRRVVPRWGIRNALTPGCYTPPWFRTLLSWHIAFFVSSFQRSAS